MIGTELSPMNKLLMQFPQSKDKELKNGESSEVEIMHSPLSTQLVDGSSGVDHIPQNGPNSTT